VGNEDLETARYRHSWKSISQTAEGRKSLGKDYFTLKVPSIRQQLQTTRRQVNDQEPSLESWGGTRRNAASSGVCTLPGSLRSQFKIPGTLYGVVNHGAKAKGRRGSEN